MQILVDADACPGAVKAVVKAETVKIGLQPLFICSNAHFSRWEEHAQMIYVDRHPQAVDLAIANRVNPGDIVVTGDYGLAALVLGKGARAISHRGKLYTADKLPELLLQRHILAKVRKSGGRHRGPAKLSKEDLERFKANFCALLCSESGC